MKRIFLGWNKPVSVLSAERLISFQKQNDFNAIDLSHLLIVVPTRQSGRLLEDELLKIAENQNSVLFPPVLKTPLNLLELPSNSANKLQEQTIMMEALTHCGELPNLFPNELPLKDSGRFEAAKTICSLRSILAEQGLTIDEAARNKTLLENEPLRWKDLSRLESSYLEIIKSRGLIDRTEALKDASKTASVINVELVIVASVPDPIPLALTALEKIAEAVPVEIWINAPQNEETSFDRFGIPLSGYFNELPELNLKNISLVKKPADAADKCIEILSEKEKLSVDDMAIALFTDELSKPFADSFELQGYKTYDPAGESCAEGVLFNLVNDFLQFAVSGDFESFASLLRNPHFTEFLCDDKMLRSSFLRELDLFHDKILPTDSLAFYNEVMKISKDSSFYFLKSNFSKFPNDIISLLKGNKLSDPLDGLKGFLSEIYSKPKTFYNHKQKELFELKIKKTASVIAEFSKEYCGSDLSSSEIIRLLLSNIQNSAVYAPHSADTIPLQGWLEMNWSPASTIIMAGFNEGYIPDSITSDLLLPEGARKALALKNNDQRMTRDLFLFRTLIESRGNGLYPIVLKTTSQGDPLKPSRILFSFSKEKLVPLASYLFGENSAESSQVTFVAERLEKPLLTPVFKKDEITKLSVTAFKSYLKCPFRFYLERVLKMEQLTGNANEMNVMEFGTLCHWALEQYGKNYDGDPLNKDEVVNFLIKKLEENVHGRYGRKPTLAVTLQLENAKRRIEKAADIEVQSRIDGWEIVAVEHNIETMINGIRVSGKIDRLEYHSHKKCWRVIDYKTSSKASSPEAVHFGKKANPLTDEESYYTEVGDKKELKLWADLQLPLYIAILDTDQNVISPDGNRFDSSKLNYEVGYFNLPDAITETGLYLWNGYSSDLTSAALNCAKEIIVRVKNQTFWPPSEDLIYDNFEDLYTSNLTDNISEGVFNYQGGSNE